MEADKKSYPALTSLGRSERDVFVILTGVSGNLGDAVIRRRVLEWSRPAGVVHAYVGRTTSGWVEELQFQSSEVIYGAAERKAWLRRLLFGRGKRVLMFDPGEVPLGREHLKSEIMFAAIALVVRLRGGSIIRPPRAVGDYDSITAWFYRLGARLSQVVLWRDQPSLELMRVGELVPDTAFAEAARAGKPYADRRKLLVTMRGKRAVPSSSWFDAIADFARARDLEIVTMAQVDEDETRCAALADGFGPGECRYIPWDSRSDLSQERAIREVYEDCAYVVSDRLHVLILAGKAGATPVEIAPRPVPKISTHFATISYGDVSFDSADKSLEEVRAFLEQQEGRNPELLARLAEADVRLSGRIARAMAAL